MHSRKNIKLYKLFICLLQECLFTCGYNNITFQSSIVCGCMWWPIGDTEMPPPSGREIIVLASELQLLFLKNISDKSFL
jgi:hypothetical protein